MTTILLRKSNTAGEAFTTLGDGEVAINQADSVLFSRNATGTIIKTPLKRDIKLNQGNMVTDFGAKCDGVTDDSAAVQTALNAIAQNGGGEVLVPGICGLSNPIYMRSGVHLVGLSSPPTGLAHPGGGNPARATFVGSEFKAIANFNATSASAMITQSDIATLIHTIDLRNLVIDAGQREGRSVSNAVRLSCVRGTFRDNHFREGTGFGFVLKRNSVACWTNRFESNDLSFFNYGVIWESTDGYISNNYISSCLSFNLIIDSTGGNQVVGNMIDGAGRNNNSITTNTNAIALLMRNTAFTNVTEMQSRNVIVGNHFGENQANDINIEAVSSGTNTMLSGHQITGNMFHNLPGNSIRIGGYNRGGIICGNDFSDIGAGGAAVVFGETPSTSPGWSLGPNTFSNAGVTSAQRYVNAPTDTIILGYQ